MGDARILARPSTRPGHEIHLSGSAIDLKTGCPTRPWFRGATTGATVDVRVHDPTGKWKCTPQAMPWTAPAREPNGVRENDDRPNHRLGAERHLRGVPPRRRFTGHFRFEVLAPAATSPTRRSGRAWGGSDDGRGRS